MEKSVKVPSVKVGETVKPKNEGTHEMHQPTSIGGPKGK